MASQITAATIQLRDYQEALLQGIFEQWKSAPRVMAQLPTGGGKTVIFSAIAQEFARHGDRVLVLAHREELITQAAAKLETVTGKPVGVIKSGIASAPLFPIQVASVQTLVNRLREYPDFGLVVTDEAHHSTAKTYRKILEAYPGSYQLGVTATPIRTDGSGFRDLFDGLVCGPTVKELIELGHLSRFKLFGAKSMETKGVRTVAGDFSAAGLAKANNVVKLSGDLVKAYRHHCPDRRCLVFAISVAYSMAIAARYNAAGISAIHLDGETPSDVRKEALARFAEGEIKVISNCGLFGEGLDIPALEAVQIARPTKSLGLWLQMAGRALRPAPGKDFAILLDHTKNHMIHGLPTRKRIWTLEGVENLDGDRRLERKPDGEIVEVEPTEIEEQPAQLVEVEELESPWGEWWGNILAVQQSRGYKVGWLYYQICDACPPADVWIAYANFLGRSPTWGISRFIEQETAGETKATPPPLPSYARNIAP
ncbi:DEAD/DEAH box helicase [Synechocystis sp. LEGE 06083]|uniref:DEAD/DEAH box helicase n=1 Tax=Synechocystis sp. LEGE 06083 TaxID=915336 RepID=UPI001882DF4D|nr:DEAD/DEAH box helicase [Synechocystis sp. LEGE 06083]MBE9193786.1 DEAD/DEAH box helicase [Synechocystis sp. LEGE 06083]